MNLKTVLGFYHNFSRKMLKRRFIVYMSPRTIYARVAGNMFPVAHKLRFGHLPSSIADWIANIKGSMDELNLELWTAAKMSSDLKQLIVSRIPQPSSQSKTYPSVSPWSHRRRISRFWGGRDLEVLEPRRGNSWIADSAPWTRRWRTFWRQCRQATVDYLPVLWRKVSRWANHFVDPFFWCQPLHRQMHEN